MTAPDRRGEAIVEEFLAHLEVGGAPDLPGVEEWIARHPHLEQELRSALENWRANREGRPDEPAPLPTSKATHLRALLERLEARSVGPSRYTRLGEIGRGGMGTVVKVWDRDLNRHLALKMMGHPGSGEGVSLDRLARFIEEAQVASQLAHPGIVPIHDIGVEEDGTIFFTMPIVEGRNFAEVLEFTHDGREGWNRTRALGVLLKVCQAMAFAHSRGVLHRDLKPANVMVGPFGETFVMDWGCALLLEEGDVPVHSDRRRQAAAEPDSPLLTATGFAVGSAPYMSPEQARGRREEMGASADVYAAGAMLYELLAGYRPYLDDDTLETPSDVVRAVTRRPPTPLRRLRKDVPEELEAICERAMAREPRDRYLSMEDLAKDLSAFLENRVVSAHRTGPLVEFRKWVARNRAFAGALLLALLVAAGAAGVMVWQERRTTLAVMRERDKNDMVLLVGLQQELDRLWPIHPERVPVMERWLEQAKALLGRRPRHVALLDALKEGEQDAASSALDPAAWISRLESFLKELDAFASTEPFGKSVGELERRLQLADALERDTLHDHAGAWERAASAIADPDGPYSGLLIAPQLGLVPLGSDPETGLWEFWHILSGARPERDGDGRSGVGAESGLVLVLLPGGAFFIGAQNEDPEGPNYDPRFEPTSEQPAGTYRVELDPFFISKYEMTQGQWIRLAGSNPSYYRPNPAFREEHESLVFDLAHPVENMSWYEAEAWLRRHGLSLPTEAQWEYACRAGTDTPFWTGAGRESLVGRINIADLTTTEVLKGITEHLRWPDFQDGYVAHCRVGEYEPNPFGLFNVHGNVFEWCADRWNLYELGFAAGDGRLTPGGREERILRGGSWRYSEDRIRSATRSVMQPDDGGVHIGVRPARILDR